MVRAWWMGLVAAMVCVAGSTARGAAPAKDVAEAARDCNSFAVDLYSRLASGTGNLFFSLYSINEAMGMSDAFSGGADFSGIAAEKLLCIGHVIHKAFVDVNEAGTEAAAATAVVAPVPLSIVVEPEPMVFRADHPFVYVIRQRSTRAILFMGRVVNPEG